MLGILRQYCRIRVTQSITETAINRCALIAGIVLPGQVNVKCSLITKIIIGPNACAKIVIGTADKRVLDEITIELAGIGEEVSVNLKVR